MSYEFDGTDYKAAGGNKRALNQIWIEPSKRERKANYSVDEYYRDALRVSSKSSAPKAPRAPKQIATHDWQFFPARLVELQERETNAYRRGIGYKVPTPSKEGAGADAKSFDQLCKERDEEQARIDTAEELTEEEMKEKEELAVQGFATWSRRDFQNFVKACERHGRTAYAAIAADIPEGSKSEEDIKLYAKTFWERVDELADHERIVQRIEEGEAKITKLSLTENLLRKKIASYRAPLQQIKLPYNQNKGKSYSEDEDRFLLVRLAVYGLGEEDVYDKIKRDVSRDPAFRFDWFIKSRTAQEIGRRCTTLLSLLLKDEPGFADEAPKANGKGPKKRVASEAVAASSRGSTPAGGAGGKKRKA